MSRHLAVMIAALIVNLLAALALNFQTSLGLVWLLFSVISTATAVAVYSGWLVLQEVRVLGASRLTKPKATGKASTLETGFRCSISDTTGLLVTYVGPDSCELSGLLAAIREFRRRPVDSAERSTPTR